MLSVLSIAQAALDEMGLPVPASIVSTTDNGQRQIKSLIQASARFFRNTRTFPQQKKQGSFTLSSGRYQYVLPTDYYAALPGTLWDDDKAWRIIGPITDAEWTDDTKGLATASQVGYRIFGPDFNPSSTAGQFMIKPTPSADGEVLSFEYVTRYMFVKASDYTTFAETIALDTDLCLFDDDLMIADLKWRYLRAKKKDYSEEQAEAKTMLEAAQARFTGPIVGSFEGKTAGPSFHVASGSWTF